MSEYGLRLIEKQKLCRNYGVTERQLRRLMILARAADGPTGERLLERLERRLDNVVFRAGFARTIPAARQLVNHGHITVDGKKVDRSSYSVAARCVERAREGSLARATSAWQWACTAKAAAGDLLVASLGESGGVTPGGSGAGGLPSPAPCPLRSLSTPYNIDNDCQ